MMRISSAKDLAIGDCVMVHHCITPDKKTPRDDVRVWRFLAVVDTNSMHQVVSMRRVVPSKDGGDGYLWRPFAGKAELYKLEPEEWPDGLHQFRMKLILSGELDV